MQLIKTNGASRRILSCREGEEVAHRPNYAEGGAGVGTRQRNHHWGCISAAPRRTVAPGGAPLGLPRSAPAHQLRLDGHRHDLQPRVRHVLQKAVACLEQRDVVRPEQVASPADVDAEVREHWNQRRSDVHPRHAVLEGLPVRAGRLLERREHALGSCKPCYPKTAREENHQPGSKVDMPEHHGPQAWERSREGGERRCEESTPEGIDHGE
mmetsp:Transcript_83760/g.264422  ORF Transcript_83760/g.264422 Transcript_83760/m.264422 type:complete len:211 (+) Transcript_83760:213-845(+)